MKRLLIRFLALQVTTVLFTARLTKNYLFNAKKVQTAQALISIKLHVHLDIFTIWIKPNVSLARLEHILMDKKLLNAKIVLLDIFALEEPLGWTPERHQKVDILALLGIIALKVL
jgi:hypothetical protein